MYVRESDYMFYHTWQFWVGACAGFTAGSATGVIWAMFNRRKLNKLRGEVRGELKGK